MRNKSIFAVMIIAVCMVLSAMLVGCEDPIEEYSEFKVFNEIVQSNVATNGYTLDSVSVNTQTGEENGYVKKAVTVENGTATTIIKEKRLAVIDLDGENLNKYKIIKHEPVVVIDYAGETLTNDIKYDNIQAAGSQFEVTSTIMTLRGTVSNIVEVLNIADATGITNCTIEATLNLELKVLSGFVIVYQHGSNTTTLTYNQAV